MAPTSAQEIGVDGNNHNHIYDNEDEELQQLKVRTVRERSAHAPKPCLAFPKSAADASSTLRDAAAAINREGKGNMVRARVMLNVFGDVDNEQDSKNRKGVSWHGREIPMLVVEAFGHDYGDSGDVVGVDVLIIGGMHAREWITTASILCLLKSKARTVAELVARGKVRLLVLPLLNPDGFEYSRKVDRHWRKNRSPLEQPGLITPERLTPSHIKPPMATKSKLVTENRSDVETQISPLVASDVTSIPVTSNSPSIKPLKQRFGVDLNRNFGTPGESWGFGDPLATKSELYQGPVPFSEAESRVLREVVLHHLGPQSIVLDVHCCAKVVFSTANCSQTHADWARELADASPQLNFRQRNAEFGPSNSGIAIDWAQEQPHVRAAFMIEVSGRKNPENFKTLFRNLPADIAPTVEMLLEVLSRTIAVFGNQQREAGIETRVSSVEEPHSLETSDSLRNEKSAIVEAVVEDHAFDPRDALSSEEIVLAIDQGRYRPVQAKRVWSTVEVRATYRPSGQQDYSMLFFIILCVLAIMYSRLWIAKSRARGLKKIDHSVRCSTSKLH